MASVDPTSPAAPVSSAPLTSSEWRDIATLLVGLPLLAGMMVTLLRLLPPHPHPWLQLVAFLAVVVLVLAVLEFVAGLVGLVVGGWVEHGRAGDGPARARWGRTTLAGAGLPLDLLRLKLSGAGLSDPRLRPTLDAAPSGPPRAARPSSELVGSGSSGQGSSRG